MKVGVVSGCCNGMVELSLYDIITSMLKIVIYIRPIFVLNKLCLSEVSVSALF